jgi:hypothetical protein
VAVRVFGVRRFVNACGLSATGIAFFLIRLQNVTFDFRTPRVP